VSSRAFTAGAEEDEDPHFCTRCAKPLARKGDVCPWCLDAWVLMRWAVGMLRPHLASCAILIGLTVSTIVISYPPTAARL